MKREVYMCDLCGSTPDKEDVAGVFPNYRKGHLVLGKHSQIDFDKSTKHICRQCIQDIRESTLWRQEKS